MPFVNIRIYEGHGKDRKDEIARRITDAITDVCKLPREAVWVVVRARSRRPTGTWRAIPGAEEVTRRHSRSSAPASSSPRDRVWHPTGKFLVFSDMPGDHMRRWSAADGITTFRKPSQHGERQHLRSPGPAADVRARHQPASPARSPTGASSRSPRTSRASSSTARTTSCAAAMARIYFTDPPYGRAKFYGVERPQELAFQGVYRVGPDRRAPELLVDDFDRPNGLCFSLDECAPVRQRHRPRSTSASSTSTPTARLTQRPRCGRRPRATSPARPTA